MAAQSVSRPKSGGKPDTRKTPAKKQTRMERFKPHLPYEGFPLFPHQSGRWAKKILQRLHYFGSLAEGWEAAIAKYKRERDDLHAGITPMPEDKTALNIKGLCNRFMTAKRHAVDSSELSEGQFDQYFWVCEHMLEAFGKTRSVSSLRPEDFAKFRASMMARWSPGTVKSRINTVKTVFNYAVKNHLVDGLIRYGDSFNPPSSRVIAVEKAGKNADDFTAAEIRKLLRAASPQLKAMILLGLNCGYGNSDISRLNRANIEGNAINIDVRIKTGAARRSPLWKETLEAIEAVAESRPDPKDENDTDAVFITRSGCRWCLAKRRDYVTQEFKKLCVKVGVHRAGRGYYNLRHVFRTVAGGAGDIEATDLVMGHKPGRGSAAVNYIGNIDDKRLRAVANHVRSWLFPRGLKGQNQTDGHRV